MPLVYRNIKGSQLTVAEGDGNIEYLDLKIDGLTTAVITEDPSNLYFTTARGAAAAAAVISDTIFGVGWNGVTTIAPSKNAVYDMDALALHKAGSENITGVKRITAGLTINDDIKISSITEPDNYIMFGDTLVYGNNGTLINNTLQINLNVGSGVNVANLNLQDLGASQSALLGAGDQQIIMDSTDGIIIGQASNKVGFFGNAVLQQTLSSLECNGNNALYTIGTYLCNTGLLGGGVVLGVDNYSVKKYVRVASTASVNVTNPGTAVFDGITLVSGDRILLKDQSPDHQNGIWTFTASGTAMVRALDADAGSEILGMTVFVLDGTETGKWFYCTNLSAITLGVTSINFVAMSGGGGGSGTVTSVSGVSNRTTITGTATINPTVDISATYVGQTSITTLGTLTTGATGAGFTVALTTSTVSGLLLGVNGGTGVANTGKTITLGGNLVTSGAHATTLTTTGTTGVTLPTTGTLATLAGSEALTNKSMSGAANTFTLIPVTALNSGTSASSSTFWRGDGTWATPGGSGDMVLASVQSVTGAKTFDSTKFILAGSSSGTTILNAAAVAGSGTVTLPTTGTLATLAGTEALTNKTLTSPVLTVGSDATGDIYYNGGSGVLARLADVSVGSYLRSGGTTTAPLWSTLKLPNAATANYIPYATSTNTIGESANFVYTGTNLGIGTASPGKMLTIVGSAPHSRWNLTGLVNTTTKIYGGGTAAVEASTMFQIEHYGSNGGGIFTGLAVAETTPPITINGIQDVSGAITSQPVILISGGKRGASGNTAALGATDYLLAIENQGTGGIGSGTKYLKIYGNGDTNFASTTEATSATVASVMLAGGLGVNKKLMVTGAVTLTDLAGTGTRLVQASSTGVLSATVLVARTLKTWFADVSLPANATTPFYSYTIPAGTLINDGDWIDVEYIVDNNNATTSSLSTLGIVFNNDLILNANDGAGVFRELKMRIMRISNTDVRISATANYTAGGTDFSVTYTTKTGLNLTTTGYVIKGECFDDNTGETQTAKMGTITYHPKE